MIKVLVVDDNLVELEIVKAALENRHFECLTVSDPRDAVRVATEYQPNIIILDLMMPQMSGFELCRDLKITPSTEHIKVVMLTSDESTESVVKGVHLGVVDYIHKPISPDELVQAIIAQEAASQLKTILEPMSRVSDELERKYETQTPKKMKIFFGSGTSWRSRLIRFVTGSRWSHVAVAIDEHDAIEACGGHTVKITPIAELESKYPVHTYREIDGDVDKIMSLLGKRYDHHGLYAFVFKWFKQNEEEWFCSEAVAYGSDVYDDAIAHTITPEDLFKIGRPISD